MYLSVPRCGVPSFDITAHIDTLESEDFAEAAACIKNFALQFCTRMETDIAKIRAAQERLQGSNTGQYSVEGVEATEEENLWGLRSC